MSWLLFLDESGHDHQQMPYEIHGGFAIHASKLWPLISGVRTLEQSTYGAYLHQYGSEIKGSKLLAKDRFKWAAQASPMGEAERRKQALNFLSSGAQRRTPRRDEFTAYGQACLAMTEGVLHLLNSFDARIFAAAIPCDVAPVAPLPNDLLRKDLVFLLERFFYFLEERREPGLLVMDGSEKQADRKLVRRIEWYFTETMIGRQRTQADSVDRASAILCRIRYGLRHPGRRSLHLLSELELATPRNDPADQERNRALCTSDRRVDLAR